MKRLREVEEELDLDSNEATLARPVAVLEPASKLAQFDDSAIHDDHNDDEDGQSDDLFTMRCSLPPHREPLAFQTYDEYEVHYNKAHTNRCLECRKNFPTEHLLNVHIEECHDPLVVLKRERGEHTVRVLIPDISHLLTCPAMLTNDQQYSCLVEGCDRKCLTHQKRRMHLIDKHMYPKNFFFAVTRDGIDGRRSLLSDGPHRRRSSTLTQSKDSRRRASLLDAEAPKSPPRSKQEAASQQSPNSQTPQKSGRKTSGGQPADTEMADLAGAMSSLTFVPPSVRFGRGRAGFSKR